jgi:L-threonine-O-3-phosphate decarboxylase
MASIDHSQEIVHGGDAKAVASDLGVQAAGSPRLDFSVNVNPFGAPPWVKGILARSEGLVERYPEPRATTLSATLAQAHGVESDGVVVGNGSTEILSWIVQALRPAHPAWVIPTYAGYSEVCAAAGLRGAAIAAASSRHAFRMDWDLLRKGDADLLFLASPNNPTGAVLDAGAILAAVKADARRTVVLDESFLDFLPDAGRRTLIRPDMPPNLIVIKSLTKFFAIPGLRLGMACSAPETLRRIEAARLPWSVNGLAQAVGVRLYADRDYLQRSRETLPRWRETFAAQLAELPGLTVHPSEAPFLLCRLAAPWTASRLQAELLGQGILIRSCRNFEGLGEEYCRLAVRPPGEQEDLMAVLRPLLLGHGPATTPCRKPAIMVVGTTSHAGKSLVAAGLCRLFARRGWRVAPFKAQNMALNSFVTADGGEMGRAQVTQARAARVEPHTDMNPVLLKPTGENGSQVIVNGRAIGTLNAREYYGRKAELRETAHAAYDRLRDRFDLIILEGAGSPAEINLREEDFVNLNMAEYAGARALLVADIDRGGVFASIFRHSRDRDPDRPPGPRGAAVPRRPADRGGGLAGPGRARRPAGGGAGYRRRPAAPDQQLHGLPGAGAVGRGPCPLCDPPARLARGGPDHPAGKQEHTRRLAVPPQQRIHVAHPGPAREGDPGVWSLRGLSNAGVQGGGPAWGRGRAGRI